MIYPPARLHEKPKTVLCRRGIVRFLALSWGGALWHSTLLGCVCEHRKTVLCRCGIARFFASQQPNIKRAPPNPLFWPITILGLPVKHWKTVPGAPKTVLCRCGIVRFFAWSGTSAKACYAGLAQVRSPRFGKKNSFLIRFVMISASVGAVALRIGPEASVFQGDADFDGPGA